MMLRRLMPALLLVLLLLLAALLRPTAGSAAPFIDPGLQATLATATDTQQIQAVVNYDSAVTTGPALSAAIQRLGLGTITFKHLDSIAVIGSASQIASIAALPGVTGLYPNTQLRYYLHESVPAIGADRVWTELGATG